VGLGCHELKQPDKQMSTNGAGNTLAIQMNTSGNSDFTSAITPLTITGAGSIGLGRPDPQAQLHVTGYNQATWGLSTSSGLGGTLLVQDIGGSYGNGGAVVFGTSQGYFAAVKGLLINGSYNTSGAFSFQLRLHPTDGNLTDVMRMYPSGSTAWIGLGNTQPVAPIDFGVSAANNKLVIGTYTAGNVWTGIGMDGASPGVRIAGAGGAGGECICMDTGYYTGDGAYTWESMFRVMSNGHIIAPWLPNSNPGAGSKKLWYDPATGHVMYSA
jgi:hypothetical protein